MDDKAIIDYNWNRIVLLCRKQDVTLDEKEEITTREKFQKKLSCAKTHPDKINIINNIRETLTVGVMDSVDQFIKKKVLL